MSGKSPKKKDLYLGKSMANLDKLSECKDLGSNVAIIIKSADKMFREAVHQDELADEERAYVLYMRYFNVIQMAKKKQDYFKQKEYFDNLIGRKNQLNAIDRAETLAKSLKERYDLQEAEAVAKKLAALEESEEKKKKKKEEEEKDNKEKNGENKENGKPGSWEHSGKAAPDPDSISPMNLFTLINDKETQIVIMDVRSAEDFRDSHISHKACINVPGEIIEPGTTVNHISNALPEASKTLWRQRGNVDHVILVDWRSTIKEVTIGSTLRTLKDALFKYDATVILKSKALVLGGGYEQWLLFYPTVTTNAHIICPAKPKDFMSSAASPRMADLERVCRLEEEKRQRRQEVERMRRDQHKKEDEQKMREQKAREAKEREASERARREEEKKKQEVASAAERAELLREEKERQDQEHQEKDRQRKEEERRLEEEKKKKEELKIQQLKKEKQEQEQKERDEKARVEKELADRLKHVEAERAKAERDQKLAAEKAMRMAEEKRRKVNEPIPQSKMVPSTNLPVGWEKRLDRSTNRYFYINHNLGTTQWEPPIRKQPDTYTTKLKEEAAKSSRGLSRSFSSPGIMKLMNEEGNKPFASPNIDRTWKPAQRFEPVVSRPVLRQYIVKKRDLNPVYGSVGPALTGLRNLGNTGYMNSTIQCLNNCTPLVAYFLDDLYLDDINRESSEGMHGEMVDDYAIVVKALWNGQYRCITPRDLKTTVGKYNPMFAGFQQQDLQEFLMFLLDGLHEGLSEVKTRPKIPDQDNDNMSDFDAADLAWKNHKLLHRSIIVELFQGQLKSSLQCKHCGKLSVTYQAFMFLSLPIPHQSRCSLRDCIQEFLKPEMMTGSCKWKCPRCRVERDAVKKIDIWKLPPILLIGLNRFVSDGMWMQKKTSHVDFPVTDLNMREYVKDPRSRTKYNLYGISNHYGTMEGGHYTAFCRNPCSKKWYKFDDTEVYEMSHSDVKTSAAFVLYYTSIELNAPKFSPQL